jgi:cytochrome c2
MRAPQLRIAGAQFGFPGFTAQDKADIIAFLKLLWRR